ncbi:MAG: S9 family peptidase, partial [Bacteroidetes bacterium]
AGGKPAGNPVWSPDSGKILYSTGPDDPSGLFYLNPKLFVIDVNGGSPSRIAADLDEEPFSFAWNSAGIFMIAREGMETSLLRARQGSASVESVLSSPERVFAPSYSADGSQIAFIGVTDTSLAEIYRTTSAGAQPEAVTDFSHQISGWSVGETEIIQWESYDGSIIEGVLHKPVGYEPGTKYPLMVVIHGGPTGIDSPTPVYGGVYPVNQWMNKGALVLRPNYRGSAGYGEAFRSLNVRNLGIGDAWDVLSGVDYLIDVGIVDTTRMGSMGWSQGGYISAFLTTNTNRFSAISVGAGISNWMTYYVSTDIHPFTRQYLKGTPWSDPDIYAATSPMTNINNATTPSLIQHGEFDKRVPIPNAYELYQGLQDVGVETRLIVYKGFGHGITKPKERLAALWHNWQWFGEHIWGEDIELPVTVTESEEPE